MNNWVFQSGNFLRIYESYVLLENIIHIKVYDDDYRSRTVVRVLTKAAKDPYEIFLPELIEHEIIISELDAVLGEKRSIVELAIKEKNDKILL